MQDVSEDRKGSDSDVGIRRFHLWDGMVVGNPCRHDNHDGSLLLYDEGTHGVDDVRPFLPHAQRLVLERSFRIGKGDLGQAVREGRNRERGV